MEETFRQIHSKNHWRGSSVSGPGSGVERTRRIREALPPLLAELRVGVLLDLPCGDFTWMQHVNLGATKYIGADIVPEVIALNQHNYASHDRMFVTRDVTNGPLPDADLILCRDCLVHLSLADALVALENVRASAARYLLATTFVALKANAPGSTGGWRPLNLERPPFDLGPPIKLLYEEDPSKNHRYPDKALGLWAC